MSASDALVLVVGLLLVATALAGLALLRRPPLAATRAVEEVRAVEVRLASGRVEIGEDDRADVKVDLTVRRRVGRELPRVTVADGTLRLDGERSEAKVRLRLPRATGVRVELRAGEVSLWGSAGDLELLTETATIAGRELSGANVTARSESGDINLHFTGEPRRLAVSGGPGAITLVVPDGEYRVEVESPDPAGTARVELASSPDAPRAVLVRSQGGTVFVRGAVSGGALPI